MRIVRLVRFLLEGGTHKAKQERVMGYHTAVPLMAVPASQVRKEQFVSSTQRGRVIDFARCYQKIFLT